LFTALRRSRRATGSIRANAPMEPVARRPADHGLFDTNARNQIEMF
jgi:hypothetical protein